MVEGYVDISLTVDLNAGAGKAQVKDICFVSFPHSFVPIWMNAGIYEKLYFSNGAKAETFVHDLGNAILFLKQYKKEYEQKYPDMDIEEAITGIDKMLVSCESYPEAIVNIRR